MSQIYKSLSSSGPIPGNIPTSFVTDNGTVIPSGNSANINGGSTTSNNNNGITVIANTTGSNNEVVQLTNRFQGSTTTVGATTSNAITFILPAIPATYFFNYAVAAFNASTPAGAGYETYTTVRTNGTTATIIGDTDAIVHEDSALNATTAQVAVSGNTVLFQVGGVTGLTIDWNVVGTYIVAT
jgi:hypothetical protein